MESAVREEIGWAEEIRRSGLGEPEWMVRSAPRVEQLMKSGEYPIFTKIVVQARRPHLSRDEQFRYGLERVLDCIAAAIPPTAEPPAPTPRKRRKGRDD